MNKIFNLLTLVAVLSIASIANAQITQPRTASPAADVKQTIGISTIKVNYSRPAVRDRAVWGNLVPYGWNVQGFGAGNSAPWRAGANENTVITLSHDAMIQGKKIPAGSYGLFFVINEDNSGEVILSSDTKAWGSFFYDEANDVMRAPITIRDNAFTERLTYDFVNIDKTSAELVLNWEKKQFPVKVEFAVDDIVMANAAAELKGSVGFGFQGWSSAANYALANNVNLEQGLTYIDNAIAQNNTFPMLRIKSGLLTALGRADEAKTLMDNAIANANEAQLNVYGYQLIGQGNTKKAVEIFLLNTERNPESANAWDSLGEGYFNHGDQKNAKKAFKKSLSLNPPANVKANSEKYLKQMGAM